MVVVTAPRGIKPHRLIVGCGGQNANKLYHGSASPHVYMSHSTLFLGPSRGVTRRSPYTSRCRPWLSKEKLDPRSQNPIYRMCRQNWFMSTSVLRAEWQDHYQCDGFLGYRQPPYCSEAVRRPPTSSRVPQPCQLSREKAEPSFGWTRQMHRWRLKILEGRKRHPAVASPALLTASFGANKKNLSY